MKPGRILAVMVGLAGVVASVVAFRRYQPSALTRAELAIKQPKPPELPKDCSELRRALALSSQSVVSGHEKALKITAELDSDATAIYLAVIQQWTSGKMKGLNVSAQTFPLDMTSFSEERQCGCLSGFPADNLLRASHSFHTLTPDHLPAAGIRLVTLNEQKAVASQNDPAITGSEGLSVNKAVEHAFRTGLFSLSEIAFDTDHRRALVSYVFHCGMLCGSGAALIFEKVDGQWRNTDQSCGGWVS